MRVRALAKRILMQLRNDKRTLALMLMAPLLILTLLYFVFETAEDTVNIGIINVPQKFTEELCQNNAVPVRCQSPEAIKDGKVTAVVTLKSGKVYVWIDGSDSTRSGNAIRAIEAASRGVVQRRPDMVTDITYVYGAEDLSLFDNFAAILMGFLVFFFVFLISGISFLKERTTGTLEKVLSTPVKRWEVVAGYVLGFGIINLVQSAAITFYLVYVLRVMMVGSIWLVLLTTLVTAISALTLGILVSTAANSEFQMIQFIPIIIVPQAFFTGLFTLPPALEVVGRFMPLYYTAEALKDVMLKNAGFMDILPDLSILTALSVIFMIINTKLLKRYRNI
ncbi:ABC transporter permease [Aminipila terrae]|uniref:ABC transporter permease n=1 Tax=Aminipila terrae TaxID=2697030 RepID=A0A6P1MGI2_9FIRM|nr:ABC transporter permease [Aminipila terrae]QHI72851.1 ABC transporter permease [Aminipila terrae]